MQNKTDKSSNTFYLSKLVASLCFQTFQSVFIKALYKWRSLSWLFVRLINTICFLFQHVGKTYHELTQTNNLLVTVNSSVNFIIYCIFRSVGEIYIGGRFASEISKCLVVLVTNSRECWVVWSGACWEGQTWQENIRIHSLTGYMTRLIENIWNLDWAYLAAHLCHEENVNLASTDLETTTASVPRTAATSELAPTRTIVQLSSSSQVTSASDISAILEQYLSAKVGLKV